MSVQPRLVKVEEEGKEFDNLLLKTLSKYFVEKEHSFFLLSLCRKQKFREGKFANSCGNNFWYEKCHFYNFIHTYIVFM